MPQETAQKKKKKKEEKLEFEAGKVFGPGESEDFSLDQDQDSDRYKAQKGQGGDRST